MLDEISNVVEKALSPLMAKLSENTVIRSMSMAMMKAMPVLLGVAVFSLLADFPVSQVPEFLAQIGILEFMKKVVTTLNNLNPIVFIVMYCYSYAEESGVSPVPNLLFGLISYFILIPSTMTIGKEVITTYSADYMAGNGMFVAVITGIFVSFIYVFMMKKNIKLKLPESVPSMVSKSFEPIFVGIFVIGAILLIDFGFANTDYKNFFTFVQKVIQGPIVAIGANVPFMILFYTLVNLLWFFGVHPSAMMALYVPVINILFSGNIGAAMQGLELPYVKEYLAYISAGVGGTGSLLALGLIMLFFSKSKRMKAAAKVGSIPVIFNVNEPMIFGIPIIMNPAFFVPMILSPLIGMGSMYLMTSVVSIKFNAIAAMSIPWTMPYPITAFIAGGIPLLIMMLVVIALNGLLYFPFFKIADKKALEEERKLEAQESAN